MTDSGERSDPSWSGDLERERGTLREADGRGSLAPLATHARSTTHDHRALVYESRDEQFAAVVPFVRQGLERGERCLYVVDENSRTAILEALRNAGVDVDGALESGALSVHTADETYLKGGAFDLEESLAFLEGVLEEATADFEGLRMSVEETWLLREETAVEDFMTLEARVNELFSDEACTSLCQYNRERFPSDVIRDVIRTHPYLVHENGVSDNVYYTPPAEFLGPERPALEVDRKLGRLQERTEVQQGHRRVIEALEAAQEGIGLLDDDGEFSYVNDAYAETFGYDPAAMIGEHWDNLGIEADPEYVYDEILPTIRREGQWTGTTTCVRSDDSTFLAEHSLTRTDDGELICVIRDVTERREREHDLELFRSLIDQSNDAVFVIDTDTGRFLDVNDTACRRLGYRRDELLELSVPDIDTALPSRDEWQSFVADLRTAGATNFDGTHRRADGTTFPVEVSATYVELDREYVLGIARDVTERERRERELERALDLLERTQRIADVGGWEIDPETRDVFWTDHVFDLLAVDTDDEPSLEGAIDMYHEADQPIVEDAVEDALEAGDSFDIEVRVYTESDERRWLRLQGVPETRDGDVVSLRGAAQDITERKRREQRLEELVERLEESNERLEQFAYAASHDLQEPLRMVSSYLQLLEQRYEDILDEDGQEFLEFAVDGADRMREMIEGLLAYSRVETQGAPLEPVDLEAVFDDVMADLQFQIETHDAKITADDLPRVEGDASQLRQVLQNLLENAMIYSGDDPPRVHISAERRAAGVDRDVRDSQRDPQQNEVTTDAMWILSVEDDGIGIDPDDADHIFQVFHRLHSQGEHPGTGIGLALCERIIERHGGRIWVDSEPGEGSTFSFTLPAAPCSENEK